MTLRHRIPLLVLLTLFGASTAEAHVKWFVEFDIASPPLPIGEVLTGQFTRFFLLSVAAVYLFFYVDRKMYRQDYFSELNQRVRRFDGLSGYIMRFSAVVFFFVLAIYQMKFGTGFYLTPELKAEASWVGWLQLGMSIALLSQRTAPLAGAGIFILFIAAVRRYGIYHMFDYPIFLGIGYFFIAFGSEWRRSGFIALFASTGITLAWAAMEKFGYPQWTYGLLEEKPSMLMGLSPQTFMVVSGFMEFFLAFVVLGAASVIGRLFAFALQTVFVLAVFEFGAMDALGHLMIVAILCVLLVRGPTTAREMLVLREKSVLTEAYFMTGLYFLAFVMTFIAYYGGHYLVFGS